MSKYKVTRRSNGMEWVLPNEASVNNMISVTEDEFRAIQDGGTLEFPDFKVEYVYPTHLFRISAKDLGGDINTWIMEAATAGEALYALMLGLDPQADEPDPEVGEREIDAESLYVGKLKPSGQPGDQVDEVDVTANAVVEYEAAKAAERAPSMGA